MPPDELAFPCLAARRKRLARLEARVAKHEADPAEREYWQRALRSRGEGPRSCDLERRPDRRLGLDFEDGRLAAAAAESRPARAGLALQAD